MKTICLYFQVHQPFRFRRYRFFDIGNSHYYYDDYSNENILHRVAQRCYLPVNKILLDLIREYGSRFKVSFSISGTAIDQFKLYVPEVIESFQKLAKTGSVEFLSETYPHSLSSLISKEEFRKQVQHHSDLMLDLFGKRPSVFRNTELIYSDEIGAMVAEMGFKAMLTEGAKHILGWKSPNYVYCNAINPRLKLLLRNFKLSDDISFRFSNTSWDEYPLTAEKYVSWLNDIDKKEQTVNIFMDYETFGEHQDVSTGILEFLRALPRIVFAKSGLHFATPSEVASKQHPVAAVSVPYPISWADEERDTTAWLGNELQQASFQKLYSLADKIYKTNDPKILKDWRNLQTGDHFYYMCTKVLSDGEVHKYFNPYDSPYDAFINYMNILSDFELRLDDALHLEKHSADVDNLKKLIAEKDQVIKTIESELTHYKLLKTQVETQKTSSIMKKEEKKATSAKSAAPKKKAVAPKTAKKTTAKTPKPAAKKTVKKAVAKKATPKKPVAKKPATKKTAVKKTVAKKVSAKK